MFRSLPPYGVHACNSVDVQKAVRSFVLKYATPSVSPNAVIWGNQPRASLPNTNEMIIITSVSRQRQGTTISRFEAIDGTTHHRELVTEDLQIDFYSDTRAGHDRASSIELLSRSDVAVDFFNSYGMSCLYADDIRDIAEPIDSAQYVQRSTLILHVCYWVELAHDQDYFDSVNVHLKNVDVLFPPDKI